MSETTATFGGGFVMGIVYVLVAVVVFGEGGVPVTGRFLMALVGIGVLSLIAMYLIILAKNLQSEGE